MVVCLTSARFNMKADILRQGTENTDTVYEGDWVSNQDPDSGEIIRDWEVADNPDTPEDEGDIVESFSCMARGILEGGIRVSGTTERFAEQYDAVDFVKIWFSPRLKISRRDRITNIRNRKGVVWMEEETGKPTIFSVTGVIPIMGPYGEHLENTALLERVETQ
jgi:hypothetical protein